MDDRHAHPAERPLTQLNPPLNARQPCRQHGEAPYAAAAKEPPARTARAFIARFATVVLALLTLPQAHGQFVSVCGTAPSGLNNCPWYQVEIVIFRNDNARSISAEDLTAGAQPRWSPRLATLLPPAGEDILPMRTAEYLALWQSAEQAPEWMQVTPGLTVEQERALLEAETHGRARSSIDLGILTEQHPITWTESDPDSDAQEDPLLDVDAGPEAGSAPDIDAADMVEPALPGWAPELIEIPTRVGSIPMDLAFRELPAGQRLLDGEAARLRRARGFEVLAQLAWRQPFAANEAGLAQLVYSADLAESGLPEGALLLGTVTIDLRRFLHAHLDLYFKAPDAVSESRYDDWRAAENRTPQWIHVNQSRRMRSGELHYLDHPWIGAIIRIERFRAPPSE